MHIRNIHDGHKTCYPYLLVLQKKNRRIETNGGYVPWPWWLGIDFFRIFSQTLKVFFLEYQDEGIMTLSENDLLVRIADHVAKLSDIVTKQSKTILDLDSRINDLENRFKPFEKAVENQRARKKQKK